MTGDAGSWLGETTPARRPLRCEHCYRRRFVHRQRAALAVQAALDRFLSLPTPTAASTFTVHGYGHGVGMSQYGANAMARSGSDFAILAHYLPLRFLVAH